jgi:hypothetical protein
MLTLLQVPFCLKVGRVPRALRNDMPAIFTAASHAQRTADCLGHRGRCRSCRARGDRRRKAGTHCRPCHAVHLFSGLCDESLENGSFIEFRRRLLGIRGAKSSISWLQRLSTMRKARIWRAFLVKRRKFSENKNAWLGRKGSNHRMVDPRFARPKQQQSCSELSGIRARTERCCDDWDGCNRPKDPALPAAI